MPYEKGLIEHNIKHIAFIMDGNGRWAKKRGLPRKIGHKFGAENFKKMIRYCDELGIPTVTVYAFSTENWKRPEDEVDALMNLFDKYIEEAEKEFLDGKNDLHVVFCGDLSIFPEERKNRMAELDKKTSIYEKRLNIAINYGGRNEIVNAVNKLIASGKTHITEDDISKSIYFSDSPEPDLVVRCGGEKRLSNFLTWTSVYSEWYFCDTLWPDMPKKDIEAAISDFMSRKRRFGGV